MSGAGRIAWVLAPLVGIVIAGTFFFHYVEGWSYVESYFFTVVTLSTVGYGNLVPQTVVGQIGTTVFIFVGLGIFALAVQQFAEYMMLRREAKQAKRHAGIETGHPAPVANRAEETQFRTGPRP